MPKGGGRGGGGKGGAYILAKNEQKLKSVIIYLGGLIYFTVQCRLKHYLQYCTISPKSLNLLLSFKNFMIF